MFYFRKRQWLAHRASYTMHVGEIPEGLTIDHLCRVRSCVRPEHLEPVTLIENLRRAEVWARRAAQQRALTHCPSGHPYEGANLRITKDGTRSCRACARRHSKDSKLRRLAANPPTPKPERTHCKRGHPYAEFGTRDKQGRRLCMECSRIKLRASRARQKALLPPKPVKTDCGKGHPWIAENIYVNPTNGQKACRKCHNERTLAAYHAKKKPRPPKSERTECAHGHPWIPANLRVGNTGRLTCRICANERNRQYEQRKREAQTTAA